MCRHHLNDNALDLGQHFQIIDAIEAEVIAFTDVRHDSYVAAIEAQAGPQHAAAGRFQHRYIDERIGKDFLGALRSAAIAALDSTAVEIDAFGVRHADAAAERPENVG